MNTNFVADITPDHAWSGSRYIDVRNPRPSDISLFEIAVGLSREQRYGGAATRVFWSVGQHTLLGLHLMRQDGVTERDLLAGFLLHDGPEYMLRDIIRPVKRNLPGYADLESAWYQAISARVGLDLTIEQHYQVKQYDNLAGSVEKRWLISPRCGEWPETPDPGDYEIPAWLIQAPVGAVAAEFLREAEALGLNRRFRY